MRMHNEKKTARKNVNDLARCLSENYQLNSTSYQLVSVSRFTVPLKEIAPSYQII